MHLDGFNLNLLVAFQALVTSSSMSQAADRLSLTQPAMSGALKRLREHYGDPLIVYSPQGQRLTPLARRLAPVVTALLTTARGAIRTVGSFQPRTSTSTVTVMATDWIELTLLKDVLALIAHAAPGLQMTVRTSRPRPADELFAADADLVFTTDLLQSAVHPFERLGQEDFVCIGWAQNARIATGLDRATFLASPHVSLTESAMGASPTFQAMDLARRVTLRTTNHAALPQIVVGTPLLAVTTRRFANQAARMLPILVRDLPYPIEPLPLILQWPSWRNDDPMMIWLRGLVRRAAAGETEHRPE